MELDNPFPHKSQLPFYLFSYQHLKEPTYQLIQIPDEPEDNQNFKESLDDYIKFVLGMQEDPLQEKPTIQCYDILGNPFCIPEDERPIPTNLIAQTVFRIKKNSDIRVDGERIEKLSALEVPSVPASKSSKGYTQQEDVDDPRPTYTKFTPPHSLTALQWATMVGIGDQGEEQTPASDLDSKTLIRTIIDYYIEVLLYSEPVDGLGGGLGQSGLSEHWNLDPNSPDPRQQENPEAKRKNSQPNLNFAHTRSIKPASTTTQPGVRTSPKHGANEDDEKADFKLSVKL